ncbi:MAG: hypothetical protein JWQ14_2310 [Adhaeribacter sp.]|nr:hypothetical protein [Adhaeribacter sp.]
MRTEKKANWLQKESLRLVIIALPFVFLAMFWTELPPRIPLHWNLQGEADGYGSKLAFAGLAALNLLLLGLFALLPHLDPKGKSNVRLQPNWHIIQVIIHLFFTYLFFIVGLTALGYALSVALTLKYGLIGLFLILGNYLATLRPNNFIGIKTPWTLRNDKVWNKTHRFAATVWVLSSLVMLIYDFWEKKHPWAFFVYLGVLVVAPVVYSYITYRRQSKEASHPKE